MAKIARVEMARVTFAEITGLLEDVILVAAEGQAASDLAAARQLCNRLGAHLRVCTTRLHRLQRQLG